MFHSDPPSAFPSPPTFPYLNPFSVSSPGFFSRLKEKGAIAKDAWGVIGSAIGVQNLMVVRGRRTNVTITRYSRLSLQEMERLQAKGEIAEEELRALEEDVTGKVG